MVQKVNAQKHLVAHYTAIGDLKYDFRNYNLFNLVASKVSGHTVIDIGCGSAHLLQILKKHGKDVFGVEPAESMRKLAKEINPGVPVFESVAQLPKTEVDTVLMIDVLEHIEDDARQVKVVASILKKRGRFIVVVPAYSALYGKRDVLMGHYRRYSAKALYQVLEENGFKIKYLRYWNALGFIPYFTSEKVFKKPLQSKSRQKGNKLFDLWFKYIENNFDFGFGLSIICVAIKTDETAI